MKKVKILSIESITHDVKRFTLEKPGDYKFVPGQVTNVAINKPGWKENTHSFTFTSLNEDKDLEFTIKGYPVRDYPSHTGMTELLHKLQPGDELLIDEPRGVINYKGSGVFIAGGAGVTPFIAILKMLKRDGKLKGNKLIFSNKTVKDVIMEAEFRQMFGEGELFLTLTREEVTGYGSGRVDKDFLEKHLDNFSQHFYLCGPKLMVASLKETLAELGAKTDSVVF